MTRYFHVYILECSDGSFYTGITNNLERRLDEHQQGINKSSFTFSRRPVKLVWKELFHGPGEAIRFEKKLKKWSAKKKKALINQDWELLRKSSQCMNESSHRNFEKE